MEKECSDFLAFASSLCCRPHIAEIILKYLNVDDIANCLKTCKGLRRIVISTLHWNPQLHSSLNDIVSRLAITNGTLDVKQYGPIKRGYWKIRPSKKRTAFGINDSLLICKPAPPENYKSSLEPTSEDYTHWEPWHSGCIYDLQTNKEINRIKLKYDYRPKLKILPGPKIHVGDEEATWTLFGKRHGEPFRFLLEQNLLVDHTEPIKEHYANDCIYQIGDEEGEEEFPWKITLYGGNGLLASDSAIRLKEPPWQILQEGKFVMVLDQSEARGVTMFDSTTGRPLWHKQVFDQPDEDHEDKIDEWRDSVVLTETFCGYMYAEYSEVSDEESGFVILTYKKGVLRLVLFDNMTGQVIHDEPGWNYHWTYESSLYAKRRHKLVAKGNYLFACAHNGNENDSQASGFDKTLLCIKVDPETLTCMVRKTRTNLEPVILAKIWSDQISAEFANKSVHHRITEVKMDYRSLTFLGFAYDGIVIGQTEFDFEHDTMLLSGKVVFSVDLSKILDMYEPCSVFAAVNFPLGQNVCNTFKKKKRIKTYFTFISSEETAHELEYYPYYQTSTGQGEGVQLTGIVEVNNSSKEPLMPKIYSFRKLLEAKDMTIETDEPSPEKRLKTN